MGEEVREAETDLEGVRHFGWWITAGSDVVEGDRGWRYLADSVLTLVFGNWVSNREVLSRLGDKNLRLNYGEARRRYLDFRRSLISVYCRLRRES